MKSLAFVLTALLSSSVAYAEQTLPQIINCAEAHQLPDGNYSISMEIMVKEALLLNSVGRHGSLKLFGS